MMMRSLLIATLVATAAPALARGTATVVRFYTDAIATGQHITLKPQDATLAQSLEFTSYANQLGAVLERAGFLPATTGAPATLTAEIAYSQRAVPLPPKRSPFSIGIGIGTGGGGIGVGGSANIPVGGTKPGGTAQETTLSVTLKRADGQSVWEGRAVSEPLAEKDGALATVMPKLIDVLFQDFPGASGKTQTLKLDKKKK
jgi:Domain of unknown function (DUF4136)